MLSTSTCDFQLACHYDTAYAQAAIRGGRDDENAQHLMLPDTEDETYAAAAAELIRMYDVRKPPPVTDVQGEGVVGEGAKGAEGAEDDAEGEGEGEGEGEEVAEAAAPVPA